MVHVVIMAGGSGTRFWPRSRKNIPKQCIAIVSDKTLIEETVERLELLASKNNIYISTGKHLEGPIKDKVPDVKYVIEPIAKNTAACMGLSAMTILVDDPDAIIVFETADHVYADVDAYIKNLKAGVEIARDDKIVLIGIKPNSPHTGFGYIEQGKELTSEDDEIKVFDIAGFKEKPDFKTAKHFFESGKYLWNSGIFISKASVMLDAIKEFMPSLYTALLRIDDSEFDEQVIFEEFEQLESVSIDYGVMEKAKNTVVVRGEFAWDDVGDWKSMERVHHKDSRGNVVIGKHSGDARNCIIFGEEKKIETGDVEGLIIVDTKDCLLVCSKDRVQEIKKIVEIMQNDPELVKYTVDIQEGFEQQKISVDCENVEIESDGVVATIGVDGLYIKKDKDKVIIKEVD